MKLDCYEKMSNLQEKLPFFLIISLMLQQDLDISYTVIRNIFSTIASQKYSEFGGLKLA